MDLLTRTFIRHAPQKDAEEKARKEKEAAEAKRKQEEEAARIKAQVRTVCRSLGRGWDSLACVSLIPPF